MSVQVAPPSIEPCVHAEVSRAQVAELARFGVATAHEAYGQLGLLTGLYAIVPGQHACGPSVTCLNHAGDNLMLHAALAVCEPGDVLVVATLGDTEHGVFGELLATQARSRGLAGVIIDAGVRDVADLRAMGFPVWARTVHARGTGKTRPGWVNVPVVCGGVVISPGDAIVADDDGVACVARGDVDRVAQASAEREAKEAEMRDRYQRGELSLDTGGLRERLANAGVSVPITKPVGRKP